MLDHERVDHVDLVRAVLDRTDDWFPFSTASKEPLLVEVALAGVARCRRLLHGMLLVDGEDDLGGLFARSLYETWVSTAYLALAGGEAYERLVANDIYEQRRFAKRLLDAELNGIGLGEDLRAKCVAAVSEEVPTRRIDISAMARAVCDLLVAEDDPNADWPVNMYTYLFAAESYTTAHGGLGAIKQYALEGGSLTGSISGAGWTHIKAGNRLGLMAAAVLVLAVRVGELNGLPVDGLRDLAEAWHSPDT